MTIAGIQQKQVSERSIRNVTRIRKFVLAVESLTKVLDFFMNVNRIAAFIWGPIKYLLLVTSTFTDAFTTLLDIFRSIGREIPLLVQYQALFEHNQDRQEVLGHMFGNIFEFYVRALEFFQASKWKQVFKAHVIQSEFAGIIEDLRRHRELVTRQADLVEFQEAKQGRIETQRRHEQMEAHERSRRKLFLRDWLDAPNVVEQQEKGQSTREARPNCGRWLLTRNTVQSWLNPASDAASCMWIHGVPGAGKTILASLLIDECTKIANAQTIYFYCRNGDHRMNDFISMCRSLMDQLSNLDGSVVDILSDMAVKSDMCFKTRKHMEKVLQLCVDAAGTVYIVLDGLDECTEPE